MEQKREIEILDVVKFIMAIMVVGIHTLGRYGIYPLFRIAVPLFFMISSYLFFSNTEKRGNLKYLKKILHKEYKTLLLLVCCFNARFSSNGRVFNR